MVRTYLFAYIFPKTDDGQPDRKMIDSVVPALKEEISLLDHAVAKSGYLAGDGLTFADLNLMPILYYLQKFPEASAAIAGAKPLASYYDRIAARPSFQKTTPPPPPPR
ncbi:MAG: glutathione binding-like protein [Xanthobacteraceae bacterium]